MRRSSSRLRSKNLGSRGRMSNESRPDTRDAEAPVNQRPRRKVGAGGRGNLIVVSAPSGAGKSSLVARALKGISRLRYSVSYTTREPRGAEKDAVDYFFVSDEHFSAMRERAEFL